MAKLQKKRCATENCGDKVLTNFYNSSSKMFPDGKVPICKKCLLEQVDENDVASVKRILRQIDKPFIYALWESSRQSEKNSFAEYMKNINSLHQYKGLTYEDSINEKVSVSSDDDEEDSDIDYNVDQKLIEKWGYGYKPEEYAQFERKYDKLSRNYGEKTALHSEGLISYIRFRVKEEMATAKGDFKEAKEWGAMASKQATDAKLNVSQLSKSDISGGVDVISQLFEAVESEVGIIPLLPKLTEHPLDDADLIIWANINYNRRLEDKPLVPYKDIWDFYLEMLEEYFHSQGFTDSQKAEFIAKRNSVFRDLGQVYIEPVYNDTDEDGEEDDITQELSE